MDELACKEEESAYDKSQRRLLPLTLRQEHRQSSPDGGPLSQHGIQSTHLRQSHRRRGTSRVPSSSHRLHPRLGGSDPRSEIRSQSSRKRRRPSSGSRLRPSWDACGSGRQVGRGRDIVLSERGQLRLDLGLLGSDQSGSIDRRSLEEKENMKERMDQ